MTFATERQETTENWIRDIGPALFLIDIAIMFSGIFFANAAAWWIWLPFHIVACTYTFLVLYVAHKASRYIPDSIPFQRPIGVSLYLSCHIVQFFIPGQIPLALLGYLLLAGPISLVFLFDHLLDD